MLQRLRDQTQSLLFKILVAAIIIVLAIFGFGAFNIFLTTDPTVASVNGEDITQEQVAVEAERERRRLAAQLGENFNPDLLDPMMLQSSAINQLVTRTLLSQAADDLGLGASEKQVNALVLGNPNFHIDGQFEENTYRRVVRMLGYTPAQFLSLSGELIGIDQLQTGITESAFYTDWELKQSARLLNQQRDVAYLAFTEEAFVDGIEVSEEDVALRYEENRLDYMTEESVDVRYVELTVDGLAADPALEPSEDEIRSSYEADKAAAVLEEQRDSRHILIAVSDERPLPEAREEIAGLKSRIEAGEDFAELAREFSEDPGSAAQGGELGPVGQGLFAPEFEAALWALEEGELSEPVETQFGVHLIQLNEIVRPEYPAFEEQREQIAQRLRREAAENLFIDRVRELDNIAFEQPDSLQAIEDQLGLTIQEANGVTRTSGSGIFGNVTLRQSVFTSEVLEQGFNSPAVEYLEGRAVVARVADRHEPEVIALEDVAEDIRAQIAGERARQKLDEAHAEALARIEAGESVSRVASDYGLSWQTHELVRRNQPAIPREVLQAAFATPRPVADTKRVTSAEGADGARYVVTVTRVQDGDVATMTEAEIEGVRRLVAARSANLDFDSFYNALEEEASIRRPE